MPRDYYNGDPYWMTTRYPGTCAGCGKKFGKGVSVFRFKNKKMFAESCGCGTHESERFNELAAVEYEHNRY